jgi:hypothetical protein
MPDHTLRAFAHHGQVKRTLDTDPANAERVLADATGAGIELDSVTNELEREGVGAFCDSYAANPLARVELHQHSL